MTEATLNNQKSEILRNYIIHLLSLLTVDYQNTKQERKEVAAKFPANEEEFSIQEEIELLTSDLRGYASQIQGRGWIEMEQQAIARLLTMGVFNSPVLAHFYWETNGEYPLLKDYLQKLDYLRLLILEYLGFPNLLLKGGE